MRCHIRIVSVLFSLVSAGTGLAVEPPQPARAPEPAKPKEERRETETAPKKERPVKVDLDVENLEPALWGYCPVSYFAQKQPVRGAAAHYHVHEGKLYFLSSEEAKKRFLADPAKYLPPLGDLCTTALGGMYGNRLFADPNVYDIYNEELFLFSSARAKRVYDKDPIIYIARAKSRYQAAAMDGYCPVSIQKRVRAMKGREEISHKHNGRTYFFANAGARADFIQNPDRYLPHFDGYCAMGIIKGRRLPSDPNHFYVSKERTYLFNTGEAMIRFSMSPTSNIEQANRQWKLIQAKATRAHRPAEATPAAKSNKP